MARRALYHTARWQEFRDTILHRDLWQCQMCGVLLTEGKALPTTAVVDHRTPAVVLTDAEFFDPSHVWSVCKGCHDGPCAAIERRNPPDKVRQAKDAYRPVGLDGYPIQRPMHRANG